MCRTLYELHCCLRCKTSSMFEHCDIFTAAVTLKPGNQSNPCHAMMECMSSWATAFCKIEAISVPTENRDQCSLHARLMLTPAMLSSYCTRQRHPPGPPGSTWSNALKTRHARKQHRCEHVAGLRWPYQGQGEEQGHAEDDHKPATAASLRPPLLLCLCRSLSRGRARGFARVQEAGILC